MWARTLLAAAILALGAQTIAAKGDHLRLDNGVLVLDDNSIDQALDTYDVMMVEFYAPWCGHCKQLAPRYKAAATQLREAGIGVAMAKVDATKAEKCSERWKVESFPQMWTFSGGDKKGDRPKIKGEVDELVNHMTNLRKKNDIKKPNEIKTKKAAEKFSKLNVGVIGIFESTSGKEFDAFANMALLQGHRGHMKFGFSTGADVAEVFKVTAPAVVLVKRYDDGNQEAPENILTSATSLNEWVTSSSQEVVCDLGDSAKSDCGNNHPMTIFIGAAKHKDEKKAFAAAAAAVRAEGKDMHFGRMSKSHKAVKEFFEIEDDELPTVVVTKQAGIYDGSKVKYFIDKNEYPDITEDVVKEVVDTYFAGDMEPTIKSADPADDDDKAMKEIVGSEFQERVLDSKGTDVMLMFYAPWCSMCKKLKPHYDQVAEVFKDIDSVMVAKMDATANDADVSGISVSGYPTIYFFKGDTKKPQLFDDWSNMDVEKFKDYIKSEASTSYDTSDYGNYEKIAQTEEEDDQPMAAKEVGASADPEPDDHDALKVLVGKNFKDRVLDSDKPWLIDFYAPWCGHCKTLMPKIKDLASKVQGHTMVGKCDLTVNDIASIHPMVNADGRGYPMLMFFQEDKSEDPLFYEGPKYVDDMESWVRGGWKTKPKGKEVKSLPEKDDSSDDLKTIVGTSFHKRVIKAEEPAMIMFAAPWCGACKQVKPEFEKIGAKFGDRALIGYFDMTANELDHPKVSVESYPTFYYFPGDDKNNPVKYTGGKDYDALEEYVGGALQEEEEDPGEDDL